MAPRQPVVSVRLADSPPESSPYKFELNNITSMPPAAYLNMLAPVVARVSREASTDAKPVVH